MARAKQLQRARVIPVIEMVVVKGKGTLDDPVRMVEQYWDFEGNFLAEAEPNNRASARNRISKS